jgi:hypothetical protein
LGVSSFLASAELQEVRVIIEERAHGVEGGAEQTRRHETEQ